MEAQYRAVAADVRPSVVLVEQAGRLGYFCRCSPIGCTAAEFDTGPTQLSHVLVLAPSSRSTVYPVPSLLFQTSLARTKVKGTRTVAGSSQMFTVSCQYGAKSPDGVSRLVGGGLVFGMSRKALGIVVGDNNDPTVVAGSGEDAEWEDDGFVFKVCMSGASSKSMVFDMLAESGVRKGRRGAKKDKRDKKKMADK